MNPGEGICVVGVGFSAQGQVKISMINAGQVKLANRLKDAFLARGMLRFQPSGQFNRKGI